MKRNIKLYRKKGQLTKLQNKKPKPRKIIRRYLSKCRFLKAIKDTGGVKTIIAEKLGSTWGTINKYIVYPKKGWKEVIEAYNNECERIGDLAEETIHCAIKQREDIPEATKNARWYLNCRHRNRGYGEERKVVVGGGRKPIKVDVNSTYNIDQLNLPLELKKKLYQAIIKNENENTESDQD